MDALFFVESPLQLLNAFEAISYYKIKTYRIVVRLSGNSQSDVQIIHTAELLSLNPVNVKYIHIRASERTIFDYIKALLVSFRYLLVNVKYVFIGNLDSSLFNVVVPQISRDKVIFLDDGAKTIIHSYRNYAAFKKCFTMFKSSNDSDSQCGLNQYDNLKQKILMQCPVIDASAVFFLGQKLSEIGLITEELYLSILRDVVQRYPGVEIYYIPHRGESAEKIEVIKSLGNIKVLVLDYPVELYGICNKQIPSKVISFYSTALYSMSVIYGIKSEAIKISNLSKDADIVYKAYEMAEQINEVIEYRV